MRCFWGSPLCSCDVFKSNYDMTLIKLGRDFEVFQSSESDADIETSGRYGTDWASGRHIFNDLSLLELIFMKQDFCTDQNLQRGDFMSNHQE